LAFLLTNGRSARGNMLFNRSFLSGLLGLIFLLLLLSACGDDPPPAVEPTNTPTPTAVTTPTITPTPQPTPTATIPPSPTPIRPAVEVEDQTLRDNGRLTIVAATVPEPAWLVIHAERDGQVGEALGYAALEPGRNEAVEVTIDPLAATERLTAVIHQDAGTIGAFEFPGPDEPLLEAGEAVSASFAIERDMRLPTISADDQDVLEDGLVRLRSVYALAPGWVAIHADEAGAPGPIIGHAYVETGENEDIVVHIPWRQGTPLLHAMLHHDNGRALRFDYPGDDLPVLLAGQPVIASFQATYPPDLLVLDQPVVDGRITVERVISNGPGWLVVYQDAEGNPGLIIGAAALADGLNEQVTVTLPPTSVTEQLFIFLHEDTEPGGGFNFPAADPQITYQGRIPNPFTFRTNPGSYVVTRDQALGGEGETAVVLPYVVADTPVWAVIYTDDDGELGDIVGQTWLPPGITRNVSVSLDPDRLTDTLHAVLHLDSGALEEFEPAGPDVPLQRNRALIRAPFTISRS
jgi:hypothetical protein